MTDNPHLSPLTRLQASSPPPEPRLAPNQKRLAGLYILKTFAPRLPFLRRAPRFKKRVLTKKTSPLHHFTTSPPTASSSTSPNKRPANNTLYRVVAAMAPRRGGGGYSSGGSSSCEYCTETTYLPGYDWQVRERKQAGCFES